MRGNLAALALAVATTACGRIDFANLDDAAGGSAADPSLLVWYPMDEDPSAGAHDATPYHRDATCNPTCPTSSSGIRGAGFAFADSQCLELPLDAALDLDTGTIAAWVRVDSTPVTYQQIVTRTFGTGTRNSLEMYVSQLPTLIFDEDAGTKVQNNYPYAGHLGVWTHVAMTWSPTRSELYADGALVDVAPSWISLYDTNVWRLGCDFDSGVIDDFLPGALDDVRFYGRVLDVAEITALASP